MSGAIVREELVGDVADMGLRAASDEQVGGRASDAQRPGGDQNPQLLGESKDIRGIAHQSLRQLGSPVARRVWRRGSLLAFTSDLGQGSRPILRQPCGRQVTRRVKRRTAGSFRLASLKEFDQGALLDEASHADSDAHAKLPPSTIAASTPKFEITRSSKAIGRPLRRF